MHCRDVGQNVLCHAMLGHAVMHSRDVSHFAPFHAMPCFIMHCRDVSHVVPCHASSCIVVMCLILPPSAAQVPAQSQHWQASVSPTVGVHSTFQPYAMAPTVTVPVFGQLKVSAAWKGAYWNPAHGHVLFADTVVGQAIAREAKGTYLSCLPPFGVVLDSISQQWFPPRQLVLTIGPLTNLPASHRGLLP